MKRAFVAILLCVFVIATGAVVWNHETASDLV